MKTSGIDALTNLIDQVKTCSDSLSPNEDQYNEANFDLWKILSALRGPDGGNEELKATYTGPIRAWISQEWNVNIGSTTKSKVFTVSEFQDLKAKLASEPLDSTGYRGMNPSAFNHYIGHIMQALEAIIRIEHFKELKKEQG